MALKTELFKRLLFDLRRQMDIAEKYYIKHRRSPKALLEANKLLQLDLCNYCRHQKSKIECDKCKESKFKFKDKFFIKFL